MTQTSRRLSKHNTQLTEWEKGYLTGKLHGAKTLIQSPNFKKNVAEGQISGDIGVILAKVKSPDVSDSIVEFSVAEHPTAGKSRRVMLQLAPSEKYVGLEPEPRKTFPIVVVDIDTYSLAVGYTVDKDMMELEASTYHKDWVKVTK